MVQNQEEIRCTYVPQIQRTTFDTLSSSREGNPFLEAIMRQQQLSAQRNQLIRREQEQNAMLIELMKNAHKQD